MADTESALYEPGEQRPPDTEQRCAQPRLEKELCEIAPKELWIKLNDLMVQFGQNICKPMSPQCEICPCTEICDYYEENV